MDFSDYLTLIQLDRSKVGYMGETCDTCDKRIPNNSSCYYHKRFPIHYFSIHFKPYCSDCIEDTEEYVKIFHLSGTNYIEIE